MNDLIIINRNTKGLFKDMNDLIIINRNTKGLFKDPELGSIWETCLRQIVFVQSKDFSLQLEQGDELHRGRNAFAFLIEVLCGLHSPVLGETEVWGQFRSFIQKERNENNYYFHESQPWLRELVSEVKQLRSSKIPLLGSNSYGSILRKKTQEDSAVSIIGNGQLVEQILPWLSKKDKVTVITRAKEENKGNVLFETYEEMSELSKVVIIAASVKNDNLIKIMQEKGSEYKKIFDLRGNNSLKGIFPNVIDLKDLFDELKETKRNNIQIIESIKETIRSNTQDKSELLISRLK